MLRVFGNRMLRRIFGSKREEVVGGWRSLYNEKVHNLYASLNIIGVIKFMRMRWVRPIVQIGETRNGYKILVRKA
jgi:hypothetical protein